MKRSRVLALVLILSGASLASIRSPAETSNPLVEQLKSPDPEIRARAARDLGQRGDASALPALVAAVNDPVVKVRREVVIALGQIRQPQSRDALSTATKDADQDIRVLAVQALVGYYTGQTPSAGLTGFVKRGWRRAKGAFVVNNTVIDPGVLVEPKVVSALVETLGDTRSLRSAREAAKGLGILVAQPAVPNLVQAAHSFDADLAREALSALAKIKDRSAGPPLMDLLESTHQGVKQDAAVTLGVLRTRDALPKLQAIWENDPDPKNKEKALEGLSYLGDPVSVPLFIRALWSSNKQMRTSAAEGLARAADPKTLPELEKAVNAETEAGVKLAVKYALAALGKHDYLSEVVQELGSRLRGDAAQAYLIELSRDPNFLPNLYHYLNSPDAAQRRRLCTVLMFTGNQMSIEPLERLSHDPNTEVASEALRALRAVRLRAATPTATMGR